MQTKSFDADEIPRITPSLEEAVVWAFEEFKGVRIGPIGEFHREHLGSRSSPSSCVHRWEKIKLGEKGAPSPNRDRLSRIFEETDFNDADVCRSCGASCLREGGRIWAYDATVDFLDRPRPAERRPAPRKERRPASGQRGS